MRALVREIHGRLEACRQIEQLLVDRADRTRECAFQLVEGDARLQRRDGVDQVRHCFRLHQVEAPVQKRAKREFAGFGETRAAANRGGR
jgi:hypothetical protein